MQWIPDSVPARRQLESERASRSEIERRARYRGAADRLRLGAHQHVARRSHDPVGVTPDLRAELGYRHDARHETDPKRLAGVHRPARQAELTRPCATNRIVERTVD